MIDREELCKRRDAMADRSVPEPGCKNCERIAYADFYPPPGVSVTPKVLHPEDGWINDPECAGYLRACAACKERKPYMWVREAPLGAWIAFWEQKGNQVATLDEFREFARDWGTGRGD